MLLLGIVLLLKGIEPDMVALWSEVEVWWEMVPATAKSWGWSSFVFYTQNPCNTVLNAFLTQTSVTPRCWHANEESFNSIKHTNLIPSLAPRPSLVPRPSTPPVFDRLQYAKTEGEGLGNFIT